MIYRLLFVACFCVSLLPFTAYCEVDVVDDSENFALLEEQQAAYEPSAVHSDRSYASDDRAFARDEPALAKDDRQINRNSNSALLDKVQGLQQEVQELRGQLELQAHDLKLLQEQQLSFYKDLDARLRGAKDTPPQPTTDLSLIDTPPSPATAATSGNSETPPTAPSAHVILPVTQSTNNLANEQIGYLAAYDLIKNKQFDKALVEMQAFVAKYPHGGYSANAHYWLGELYMVKKDYPGAIEHFNVVLQEFPSSTKSAACLLKTGYALAASGKKEEARVKLQDVIKKYPDTSTARLAATKLKSLAN